MIFETGSPEETRALGERLGRVLEPGDVVSLEGELGAGKTCFVQGLARGAGVAAERRISSPTFTIVNEHPGRFALYHVDLYRLEEARELEEVGLREYLEGGGVAVVEWFDRFPDWKPPDRIDLKITITGEESRRIEAQATGALSSARLSQWEKP
jgi:tRNA threonylcarbamoyladenosine biosynthesis protein TsaE